MRIPRIHPKIGIIVPTIVGALILALSLAGVAFGIGSGGFPSRPRFQAIGINTAPSSTNLNVTGNSGANTAFFQGAGAPGNNFGVVIAAGANSSDYALRVENASQSGVSFQIDGAGNISTPAPGTVPWLPSATFVPKVLAANVTNTGSACSIFNSSGGTVTCTFNSTTSIKVNLPFNFEPSCTTTAYGAGVTTSITSPSAGSMTVGLSSGATNFAIVCVGNPN